MESTLLEVKRMGDEVKNFWGKDWEGGNIWNVKRTNKQTNKQVIFLLLDCLVQHRFEGFCLVLLNLALSYLAVDS